MLYNLLLVGDYSEPQFKEYLAITLDSKVFVRSGGLSCLKHNRW